MATLVSFWSFFGDRMADLGLIDSKRGLYIKINVNNGQNKFEVHISKNVAKMAILWPKIGQRHFGARASHGHNLAIFHQILTNEHTKMTSSLRRIEWNQILSSISLFYILVFWDYNKIKEALTKARTARSLNGDQRAMATGYLSLISKPTTVFLLHFLCDVMKSLDYLTTSFQTVKTSLVSCLDLLESVVVELDAHKATYTKDYIKETVFQVALN